MAAGDLDRSFGSNGIVTLAFPSDVFAMSVAIQADGGIVSVGAVGVESDFHHGMAIARVDADGRPDASFVGDVGRSVAPGRLLFRDEAISIVTGIQPWDQKIVIVGQRGAGRIATRLIRLNGDGTLDRTFAFFGISDLDIRFQSHSAALWIRPDRGIMVGGVGGHPELAGSVWSLARLRSNGLPEREWAMRGYSLQQVGLNARGFNHLVRIFGMAPTTHQALIVVGSAAGRVDPERIDIARGTGAIAKFKDDGTLDSTYGEGGALLLPTTERIEVLRGLALTHNEYAYAGGARGAYVFANPRGQLTRFGMTRASDIGSPLLFSSPVVIQRSSNPSEEKALLAGRRTGEPGGFGLHRFESYSATPDSSFGDSGRVTTPIGDDSTAGAYAMALQPDGKLVVAGGATVSGKRVFALARYELD